MSELTTASVWIAGLAIVAIIAAGWRKPARAAAVLTREGRRTRTRAVPLAELPTTATHRPTPMWKKVWSVVAASGLAVVTGAVLAILLSFAIAYSVITLTSMLKR